MRRGNSEVRLRNFGGAKGKFGIEVSNSGVERGNSDARFRNLGEGKIRNSDFNKWGAKAKFGIKILNFGVRRGNLESRIRKLWCEGEFRNPDFEILG